MINFFMNQISNLLIPDSINDSALSTVLVAIFECSGRRLYAREAEAEAEAEAKAEAEAVEAAGAGIELDGKIKK